MCQCLGNARKMLFVLLRITAHARSNNTELKPRICGYVTIRVEYIRVTDESVISNEVIQLLHRIINTFTP